jgi:DDE superfamily endonuclease
LDDVAENWSYHGSCSDSRYSRDISAKAPQLEYNWGIYNHENELVGQKSLSSMIPKDILKANTSQQIDSLDFLDRVTLHDGVYATPPSSCTVLVPIITLLLYIILATAMLYALIIMRRYQVLERWIVDELPNSTAIAVSETGYSNDDINLSWLRHFEEATRARTEGRFRLLLLDGFASHIEYDFVKFAQNNRIILFSFPPHTTHLL